MEVIKVKEGSIVDMEEMGLDTKLDYLRADLTLKTPFKTELLAEHDFSWTTNGLRSLQYSLLKKAPIPMTQPAGGLGSAVKITVDVELNRENTDDWSPLGFVPVYGSGGHK